VTSGPTIWVLVTWLACFGCQPAAGETGEDPPAGEIQEARATGALAPQAVQVTAESLYAAGAHDSAGVLFRALLGDARRQRDASREARALTWLGLNAWRSDDYGSARRLGREALALKLRLGLPDELFQSYNALGLLAYSESRYTDAIANFEQAIPLAERAADTVSLAKAWTNRALALVELGDYGSARALLDKALPAARSVGDRRIEGRVLTNLGMVAVRVGTPAVAVEPLVAARQLAIESGDYLNQVHVLGQLASAFSAMGEPGRALASLDTALRLSRNPERGSRLEEASVLDLLAGTYVAAGEPRRALPMLHQAMVIHREVGLPHERAAALRQVASIQAALGNHAHADSVVREALAAHRALGTRLDVIGDLVVQAEVRHEAGQPAEARRSLAEARQLAKALGSTSATATVALAEARIADAAGRSVDVLRLAREYRDAVLDAGPDREWELHSLVARAYRRRGDADSALAAARRSVAAVERIRGAYGSAMLRTSYVADRSRVYADLADLLVSVGKPAEALEVSDAARGRVVLEYSREARGSADARTLAEEERQLLRQIDTLTTHVDRPDAARPEMLAELQRTRALLERTREEFSELLLRSRGSADASLVEGQRLGDLQRALGEDQVLVEYLVADSALLTFAVSRDTVVASRLPVDREDFAGRARAARDVAGQPDAPAAVIRATFRALGELLLGAEPIRQIIIGKRSIVVAPHAELVYVPFAALVNPASGRWLSDDYSILSLPSAGMLLPLTERASGRGAIRSATAFAPFPIELPFTRREVRNVFARGVQTRARSGRDATEKAVRAALLADDIVHVASHGVLNRVNPLFSRVDFARGRRASSEDDGRLEVHEVLGLSLRPRLVFLSGCETGAGVAGSTQFDTGEDYATLAQAFLHAGATNVLATFWKVRDDGAAEFAARFYEALEAGSDAQTHDPAAIASALAKAQRGLRADPRFSAPYYWAPYVLSGSGRLTIGRPKAARASAAEIPRKEPRPRPFL
jgi:tetratricopeptide (TPR) repeat protein